MKGPIIVVLALCVAATAAQTATNRTTALPAPAAQPGVSMVYTRADGGLSMRMADGSTAYAWPTVYGYTVSFPASARGVEIWTRTRGGWSVTQTRREGTAAVAQTRREGSARTVRRIR